MGWAMSAVVSFRRVASLVSRHAVIGEYDRESRMAALTCATGGMANFRDGPGTPSAKSISSCSVKPSFWAYAGRLYFATSVSMVTSAVVYASLDMYSPITRRNGDETEKTAGVGDGGVVKAGDGWVGQRDDDEVDERVDGLGELMSLELKAAPSTRTGVTGPAALPAGGCSKAEPAGGPSR